MNNFWVSVLAAQKAGGTKPASSRNRLFQIVGGIAVGLFIGAGLLIAVMFNS